MIHAALNQTGTDLDRIWILTHSSGDELGDRGLNRIDRFHLADPPLDQRLDQPPPSAAKQSSSRIQSYIDATGTNQAWELDALKPAVIQDLITNEMDEIIDWDLWNEAIESERIGKLKMLKVMNNWDRIMEFLDDDDEDDFDDY